MLLGYLEYARRTHKCTRKVWVGAGMWWVQDSKKYGSSVKLGGRKCIFQHIGTRKGEACGQEHKTQAISGVVRGIFHIACQNFTICLYTRPRNRKIPPYQHLKEKPSEGRLWRWNVFCWADSSQSLWVLFQFLSVPPHSEDAVVGPLASRCDTSGPNTYS